jgi:hypothetical protein
MCSHYDSVQSKEANFSNCPDNILSDVFKFEYLTNEIIGIYYLITKSVFDEKIE